MSETDEYKEGKIAAAEGKHVMDNPYKSTISVDINSTAMYKDWLDGFLLVKTGLTFGE
jgi:hypothetical protein